MGYMGHGPMDDLHFFTYSIINTGWILTKILLDIDNDVFYLNTGQFFHDGFIKGIFPMDFKFCLLADGRPPCSGLPPCSVLFIVTENCHRMRDDVITGFPHI